MFKTHKNGKLIYVPITTRLCYEMENLSSRIRKFLQPMSLAFFPMRYPLIHRLIGTLLSWLSIRNVS